MQMSCTTPFRIQIQKTVTRTMDEVYVCTDGSVVPKTTSVMFENCIMIDILHTGPILPAIPPSAAGKLGLSRTHANTAAETPIT